MLETWVIFALIAFAGYFFVNFLMRYVAAENPLMVSLVLYAVAAIAMFVILAPKMEFAIAPQSLMIAAVIGLCSVGATVFAIKSIGLAPNPGYSVAIFSANFVVLTVVSMFAFGSELTMQKVVGILATLVGLVLLSI